jgi:non-specific serine/threonine protein kinase
MTTQSAARYLLSGRQAQVANLVVAGKLSREIAEMLHLSPRTVEHHIEAIFNKFGVRSRVELAVALLGQGPTLSPDGTAHPPKTNLPAERSSLVGREAEIADIVRLLQVGRLVTVTGAGGVGKTRTALAIGGAQLVRAPDGAWLVDLASLSKGSLVAGTIARALSVEKSPNEPVLETLLAYLKPQSLLLILDNCEHLIADAAVVVDALLRRCPDVRILATSREPLRIAGEHTYRLPSLRVPTPAGAVGLNADRAAEFEAVKLFVQRARAIDRGFALDDGNAAIVAEICRRLDGIPLAIELAAARVNILPVRALSQKLDQRFAILDGGNRTALPRHQTMRALIGWSHDLLDERERTLFRRLGIFVNGFTLDGAVGVCCGGGLEEADVFEALGSLVDKSLVLVEKQGVALRYRMLESTRAYACEKLEEAGELREFLTRRLCYLRDIFMAARVQADRKGGAEGIDTLLVAELDDMRAAIDAVTGGSEIEICAELLDAIATRWERIGLSSEGAAYLERIISLLPVKEFRLKAGLSITLAYRYYHSDAARGRETSFVALGLARAANDPHTLAGALTVCAAFLVNAGDFDDAAAALSEAEDMVPAWNAMLRDQIISVKAMLKAYTGDFEAAAEAYDELRTRRLQLGNVFAAHHATLNLAEAEHLRGRTEEALALSLELLSALRDGRDRFRFLYALRHLSTYLTALDRLPEARAVACKYLQEVSAEEYNTDVTLTIVEVIALVIALSGNVRCGAQLAAYAEASYDPNALRRKALDKSTRRRLEAVLRERLGPTERSSLDAVGASLTPEGAIALARAALAEIPAENHVLID